MWQFGLVLRVTVLILSKGKGKGYPLQTSPLPEPYDSFRTADLQIAHTSRTPYAPRLLDVFSSPANILFSAHQC